MNSRAKNKVLLGAQVDNVVVAGVETWLARFPSKTKTDFLLEACLEKLGREGIILELGEKRSQIRQRKQPPPEAFQKVKVTFCADPREERVREQVLREQAEEVQRRIKAALEKALNSSAGAAG